MMISPPRPWSEAPLVRQVRGLERATRQRLATLGLGRRARRLWWPIEAGTELPQLYARDSARPMPAYIADRDGTDLAVLLVGVRRRVVWQRRLIVAARALWLALLLTLLLLLARLLLPVPWTVIGAAVLGVALLAALYLRSHPITTWTAARLLDRHWRLHEQLTTALELAISPSSARLAQRQVTVALERLRAERKQHRLWVRPPWAELQVGLALALLVVGLSLFSAPAERLATPAGPMDPEALGRVDLEALGPIDPEMLAQIQAAQQQGSLAEDYPSLGSSGETSTGLEDMLGTVDAEALRQAAELSQRSSQELQQLAEALKDASVTSQAAQQIEAGQYEQAAQGVADLARSIEQLSPEARRDLAERLKQAAQQVQSLDPEMARRLEQASKGLTSRSDRAAAQSLEDLSKAISETGRNVISQSQLASAMQEAQGGSPSSEDGPARAGSEGGEGEGQAALGEGDPGQYSFGSSEGMLSIGASSAPASAEDGSGGPGAGRGAGSQNEQYTPSTSPNAERQEVPIDTGDGPTAQRPGRSQQGRPDVIATGPGATGPGNAAQGNLPISTGLDANRVPRPLQSVIQGYFKNQPPAPAPAQAPAPAGPAR